LRRFKRRKKERKGSKKSETRELEVVEETFAEEEIPEEN